VTACTGYTAAAVIEAVIKAMEKAVPTQAFAGVARRVRFVIAGADRDGGSYIWHCFTNRGGAGANAAADGWNNLGSIHNPGASPSASIERTETAFPFFIETYEFVPDTAGAGARRGGSGALYVLRYEGNGPAVLNATGEGVRIAPYGLAGGRDGVAHDYAIETGAGRAPLDPKAAGLELRPGDRIVCRSAGGGGWGDPRTRERALVERDLEYGFISEGAAREVYGL
jgi:N-methylhydantoinase B